MSRPVTTTTPAIFESFIPLHSFSFSVFEIFEKNGDKATVLKNFCLSRPSGFLINLPLGSLRAYLEPGRRDPG